MSKKITQFKKGKKMPNQLRSCDKNCMREKQRNALEKIFNPWSSFEGDDWLEPNIEVSETAKTVNISAELPGMNPDDIQVNVSQDGYITISGAKNHQHEENDDENGLYFSERSYGMIQRTIPLPQDLNYEATVADFENGVLNIHIPKTEEAKRKVKKIPVQTK